MPSICKIAGCEKKVAGQGLCGMHYIRMKRHGTTDAPSKFFGTAAERFSTKFEPVPETGCWLWLGGSNAEGYGSFRGNDGKTIASHRFAYMEFFGQIPEGMEVCHKCDIPSCVNPAHLFIGTHKDNMDDRDSKGRTGAEKRLGENSPNGKLTENDVRTIREIGKVMTQESIAAKYGISHSTVGSILRRQTWNHI